MKRFVPITLLSFALAVGIGACGKSDKDKDKDKGKNKSPAAGKTDTAAKTTTGKGTTPVAEEKPLPPPPADAMQGKGRVINLFVDAEGKSKKVDVWARRSFTYGPLQLAKNLELGMASDWFDVPKGQSVVIVEAGAGSDAKELGGIFGPKPGEHITGILTADASGASVGSYWETAAEKQSGVPEPPPAGKGLIMVRAGQLRSLDAFEKSLRDAKIDNAFVVGDGNGSCLAQRAEETGGQPAILGGTNPTEHLVDPGKVTISLHGWMESDKCAATAVLTTEVEVNADTATLVVVYTPDAGKTITSAQFPMAVAVAAAE